MQVLNSITGYRTFPRKKNKPKQNTASLNTYLATQIQSFYWLPKSNLVSTFFPLIKYILRRYHNKKNGIPQLHFLWVRPIHNAVSFCYFTFPMEYRVFFFHFQKKKEYYCEEKIHEREKVNHYNIQSKVFLWLLNEKVTIVGLSKWNLSY